MMNNLELMRKRLEYQGGIKQEDRMIQDKYKTFNKALYYSYQGCDVQLVQPFAEVIDVDIDSTTVENTNSIHRALINPNKLKPDYDDKILSIDYNTNFGPGDVFQWLGTETYWLVYLEALTEDSYFRGDIRRCRHIIKFKDKDDNWCSTWAAIRGPIETQIVSNQKNQIRIDQPNLSLNILMPLNDKTLEAFDRYSEFLFAGKAWKVQAFDSISMRNVLEVQAEEYYIDKDADDLENEVVDGLIVKPVDPTPNSLIKGETFIKPKIGEFYTAPMAGGTWSVLEDFPVNIKPIDDITVEVTWQKYTSGQFTLQWVKDDITEKKVIVVESLF